MISKAGALLRNYQSLTGKRVLMLTAGLVMLTVTMIGGVCTGASGMDWTEVLAALFRDTGKNHSIVWLLRLPRTVMAALIGFGLGTAGAVFQAVLGNPLASPYTLGVGSAAGFGAVTAIVFLGGSLSTWRAGACAFAFSLASAGFIMAVARLRRASSETMILAGIAQMFLFSSLTSMLQYLGTREQVYEIVFWFFGSLSKAGWPEIALASVMILPPLPLLVLYAWDYNLLVSGDESAMALGVDVKKLRMHSIGAASLMTAGGICFTGVIGFVGLVAPHITRMLLGNDHRFLFPASGITGALLVVAADTLGRTLWAPQVIPVGIVTAFIGVPFFFYLLMKRTQRNR
ncbi:MAG: iron ABC transporter permease [Pseudomonadota bacterium]